MILSFIIFTIIALSYKSNYGVRFSYYALIITLFRAAFRLLDFEKTKVGMEGIVWEFTLISYTSFNYFWIAIISIMFANYKYNKLIMILCLSFTIVCNCFGISTSNMEDNKIMIYYIPFYILQLVYVMYLGRHIPDMIKLILKKSKFYNKFKQIYDSLDETIMIINKKNYSVEYMNDFFFT